MSGALFADAMLGDLDQPCLNGFGLAFSVGTDPCMAQELGDGAVCFLGDKTHGETVPVDICHYVEGQTVVTIVRQSDGQCVASLERAIAIAKSDHGS